MARSRKVLQVNERHIYTPEITHCPHCGSPLTTPRHYQWHKTGQHLEQTVYVVSRRKTCGNPQCVQHGQGYSAAVAQMETVPAVPTAWK